MAIKKCQWILPHGNKCRQPVKGEAPRKAILKDGTKLYLCENHINSKNCKGYYYNNHESEKGKKNDYKSTEAGKLVTKKSNAKRYFSRTGHPGFVYKAAKNYWSYEMKQKFKLTITQLKNTKKGEYNRLYTNWEKSKFKERLTPMITKIHFKNPYSKTNFIWVTFELAGYNPGYMKELLNKVTTYHKNLLKRTLEDGGISTEYEFL